jgi:hypothetical protein
MPKADLGTANGSESTCLACGGRFHHLSKCFYVFPDTAPNGFMEKKRIRNKVQEALKNPQLQEVLKGLKHQS